jgi:hypothetical protein
MGKDGRGVRKSFITLPSHPKLVKPPYAPYECIPRAAPDLSLFQPAAAGGKESPIAFSAYALMNKLKKEKEVVMFFTWT